MSILAGCYDLKYCPPTYDIVAFLVELERERIARGCDGVSITIAPGPVGGFRDDKWWPYDLAGRIAMRDQVAVPLCSLLPSCRDVRVLASRAMELEGFGANRASHGLRRQVEASAAGVRPLRPRNAVARRPDLVTITLREAEHWPSRNSNVAGWIAAAEKIKALGFEVIFVRDTCRAHDPVAGFECSSPASLNIDCRAELYAAARVNLGVNNGPLWMALAMDAPVLMLRPVDSALGVTHGGNYFEQCGIPRGGQMPGAPSWQQRIDWRADTEAAIVEAFEAFIAVN